MQKSRWCYCGGVGSLSLVIVDQRKNARQTQTAVRCFRGNLSAADGIDAALPSYGLAGGPPRGRAFETHWGLMASGPGWLSSTSGRFQLSISPKLHPVFFWIKSLF